MSNEDLVFKRLPSNLELKERDPEFKIIHINTKKEYTDQRNITFATESFENLKEIWIDDNCRASGEELWQLETMRVYYRNFNICLDDGPIEIKEKTEEASKEITSIKMFLEGGGKLDNAKSSGKNIKLLNKMYEMCEYAKRCIDC